VESLLFFALIIVAFYFLIIRPQRTRARQADQMRARLAPGVEVMTTAGLFGTIVEVLDDSVRLEVAPGVTERYATAAIGRVVSDNASADDDTDDGDDPADTSDTSDTADTTVVDLTDEAGSTERDAETSTRRTQAGE
jgi:preprotein translocase subunit YajC